MIRLRQPEPAPFDEGILVGLSSADWAERPLRRVELCDLIPTQPWVWLPHLINLLAGQPQETEHEGIVVVYNVLSYLWDGHNNFVRLAFTGSTTMLVRVVDCEGLAAADTTGGGFSS